MAISLRKAINEKCKDCTYDEYSGLGNWRQQTTLCTVKLCPLWPVRPISSGKAVFERLDSEAIQSDGLTYMDAEKATSSACIGQG